MAIRATATVAALALLVGVSSASAAGKNNVREVFESTVIGSVPGETIGGVKSGGAPWVVSAGEASIAASGVIHVEVSGLLLAPSVPAPNGGTTGPVRNVAASLVCDGSGGTVVATTGAVPLSPAGNADIKEAITLPASCAAPVVLVRIFNATAPAGSQLGAFIAVTGFTN
jgi:hypothetical protein